MTYRQTINGAIVEYPLSTGEIVRMTPTRQKEFEKFIGNEKNEIIPKGFLVSKSKDKPWFEQPGVDRRKLDETARQFENANPDGSLRSGDAGNIEGGSSVSERRAQFLNNFRRDRLNVSTAKSKLSGRVDRRDIIREAGPYERGIGSGDAGDGLLTLTPSADALGRYQAAGLNLPPIREVPAQQSAAQYNAEMTAAMSGHKFGAQVEIKSPEELAQARLFRTEDGSGFAIKPDGDIVAVFAGKNAQGGSGYSMLQAAVQAGGRKLDAFDTYLPKIYETAGFRPVARLPWNDEYAPPGWNKETFAKYNNGEPDVVFFVYDPEYFGGARNVPVVSEYDQAVALQDQALRQLSAQPQGFAKGGSVTSSRRMLDNLIGKKFEGQRVDATGLQGFANGGEADAELLRRQLESIDNTPSTRTPERASTSEQAESRSMLDRLKRFTSLDQPQDMSLGETAADIGMGFLPVVGTAQGARDFERARREGDRLGMGLSAASMIPVAGGAIRAARKAARGVAEGLEGAARGSAVEQLVDAAKRDDLADIKWPESGQAPLILMHNTYAKEPINIKARYGRPSQSDANFDGIFAGPNGGMYGDQLHAVVLDPDKILDHYTFIYDVPFESYAAAVKKEHPRWTDEQIERAWDYVSEDKNTFNQPDEDWADLFGSNPGYAGWAAQGLRGAVARNLGYEAVHMIDETGISTQVLSGANKTIVKRPNETFGELEDRIWNRWKELAQESNSIVAKKDGGEVTSSRRMLERLSSVARGESPRVSWRLLTLREWSHEQTKVKPIFP